MIQCKVGGEAAEATGKKSLLSILYIARCVGTQNTGKGGNECALEFYTGGTGNVEKYF